MNKLVLFRAVGFAFGPAWLCRYKLRCDSNLRAGTVQERQTLVCVMKDGERVIEPSQG